MARGPPEPPEGVSNFNHIRGLETDGSLRALRDVLEREVSEGVVERLTRAVDEEAVPENPGETYRESALEYVEECIEYRDELRPDSLRQSDELPDGIARATGGSWVWYYGDESDGTHDVDESEADVEQHGKYLFFTPEVARVLENVVVKEFQERPFSSAKIPTVPAKRDDWVLCLYSDDNRYLSTYSEMCTNIPDIRFTGFKTDAATRRGEYSEKFERTS